jgi:hypothetical protein
MFKKIILLFLLSSHAYALSTPFIVTPVKEGWFEASPVDVRAVTRSAASVILRHMPKELQIAPIVLKNGGKNPVVLFREKNQGVHTIFVNIKGRKWAQLAYQFSHELCHILANYEVTQADVNQWFEEALCEASSLYTIEQMSISWKTNPPYPTWQGYAAELNHYYQDMLASKHRYLQAHETVATWYKREKEVLRKPDIVRAKVEVVGTKIYFFFKENPDRWRSMNYLNRWTPKSDTTLQQHLMIWEMNLPDDLKHVARTITSWFGY